MDMKSSSSSNNRSKDDQRFSPSSNPSPNPPTNNHSKGTLTLEESNSICYSNSNNSNSNSKRFSVSPSSNRIPNPSSNPDTPRIMATENLTRDTAVESSSNSIGNNSKDAKRFSVSPSATHNPNPVTSMAETLFIEEDSTTPIEMLKNIENLPLDVIEDILSRLPIDSLFQCKQVCPSWRSLINHPDRRLAKLHYKRSIQNPSNPTSLILFSDSRVRSGTSCSPASDYLNYIHDFDTLETVIKGRILPFQSCLGGLSLLGSCNGFLCLLEVLDLHESNPKMIICNPVNGYWVKLPDSLIKYDQIHFGFAYNPKKKEYKVVRMHNGKRDDPFTVFVLTVGSNTWRSIGTITNDLRRDDFFGVHVNGVLHWINVDSMYRSHVLGIKTFNVDDETFGVVHVPVSIRGQEYNYWLSSFASYFSLGVLEGCLMLVDHSQNGLHRVWLMKDYDNKSWVLEFIIPYPPNCTGRPEIRPLRMQRSGNILIECDEKFFSYDPIARTHELLTMPWLPSMFTAIPHVGTLVKLEDVIAMEAL